MNGIFFCVAAYNELLKHFLPHAYRGEQRSNFPFFTAASINRAHMNLKLLFPHLQEFHEVSRMTSSLAVRKDFGTHSVWYGGRGDFAEENNSTNEGEKI